MLPLVTDLTLIIVCLYLVDAEFYFVSPFNEGELHVFFWSISISKLIICTLST
ncbi:hypothetical protein M758_9G132900 [Ceratodon purpureus]|uniref:NADH dehydrogenase subunit 3 n=1 Tax=Ceratodon purpureus TaxID=3225 RepID=A0A8T0GSI9_CERPU|nr:hypothetical protein KC19_9G060900 [Ceratodon purpureus]KAG0606336.1 hypothetical protein M758_9G132900 [Ceratodon purpureus]